MKLKINLQVNFYRQITKKHQSLLQFRFDPERRIQMPLADPVEWVEGNDSVFGLFGSPVFCQTGCSRRLRRLPFVCAFASMQSCADQPQALLRYSKGTSFSHAVFRACAACRSLCWWAWACSALSVTPGLRLRSRFGKLDSFSSGVCASLAS